MKKPLFLALSLIPTSLYAQTYTQLQWGINKNVTPYDIAINVNNVWYSFANFTPGVGPSIYINALAVKSAPYSQKSITVSSAPSYTYPYTNPTTFNGDFSNTFLPFSYTVNGAATLGQPTTGYRWSPAVTPIQSYTVNNSGWNQSTSSNDGRTGFAVYRTSVVATGQGDSGAYYGGCWTYGTKAGATHWLASPACNILSGDINGGANNVYLQGIGDLNFNDSGFDVAAISDTRIFNRTNNTASLGQIWMGFQSSSRGSKNIDNAVNIYGPTTVGVDTVLATNTSAAINMAANQKIVLNSTATPINGISWFGNSIGNSWLTHSSSDAEVQVGYNNNIAAAFTSASGTTDHFLIGAAANVAYLSAEGPDANIFNLYSTKGTAGHIFRTGGLSGPIAFQIDFVGSAVNNIKVAPSITGSAPTLSTFSATDTDVGLNINTQGSGALAVTSNTFGLTSAGAARLGKVSSSTGSLAFANASSANLTTLQAGNASAAVTYTLPTAAPGGSGYALVSTAGGVMSWAAPSTIATLTPGTTPTSGGAAGQLMYDTGSVLQESANLVFSSNTLTVGKATSATGSLALGGATSGTATITAQSTAGTPTLTLPNTSGTFAVGASSPLALNTTTGNLTCTTCATTTNGGALSATAPVALSAGGAISITGAAGQVLAGASPAFTATPTLGVAGTTAGSLTFAGGTSGSLQVKAADVAGSGSVLTFPGGTTDFSATGGTSQVVRQSTAGGAFTVSQLANTDITGLGTASTVNTGTSGATIPLLNGTNTWSANQTFNGGLATFQNSGAFQPQLTIQNNANDANAAYVILRKSRSAGPSQVNDAIGTFLWSAFDSTSTAVTTVYAQAVVDTVSAGSVLAHFNWFGAARFVEVAGSANAFNVARNSNASNAAFNVDTSTASSVTGVNIKAAAGGGGVAVTTTSSGANENITLDAKGTGTITLNGTATGQVAVGVPFLLKSYTIAALPACSATLLGSVAAVSDGTAYATGTYGSAVSATGAVTRKVLCTNTGGATTYAWAYN